MAARDNSGRYGQNLTEAPTQGKNESRDAYLARLKEWQRRRSMSGSKGGTKKVDSSVPKSADVSSPQNPKGWMGKVIRALKGDD